MYVQLNCIYDPGMADKLNGRETYLRSYLPSCYPFIRVVYAITIILCTVFWFHHQFVKKAFRLNGHAKRCSTCGVDFRNWGRTLERVAVITLSYVCSLYITDLHVGFWVYSVIGFSRKRSLVLRIIRLRFYSIALKARSSTRSVQLVLHVLHCIDFIQRKEHSVHNGIVLLLFREICRQRGLITMGFLWFSHLKLKLLLLCTI